MIVCKWKRFIYHLVEHEINTPLQQMDLWQEERNVKEEDKQSFSLFLIRSTVMQTKQNQ